MEKPQRSDRSLPDRSLPIEQELENGQDRHDSIAADEIMLCPLYPVPSLHEKAPEPRGSRGLGVT